MQKIEVPFMVDEKVWVIIENKVYCLPVLKFTVLDNNRFYYEVETSGKTSSGFSSKEFEPKDMFKTKEELLKSL